MNPDTAAKPNARKSAWKRMRPIVVILAALLLVGAVYTVRAISRSKQAQAVVPLEGQFWTVKRGPLVISLLASGTIKAKQSTEIKCLVHGDPKIAWIVDEGTVVKPGDKIVELESQILLENTLKQRIQVAQAQSEYEQAKQNLDNQKSKNYSDIIIAQNKYDMAVLDLDKYIKGDYLQKLRESESAIKLAEAELKRARERLDGTKKLLAKGYVNGGELEADSLAETKCAIELDKANSAKELLEKFEYKRETSSLQTAMEGAREELSRTKKEAESTLANMQTKMDSAKAQLELERVQLNSLEEQLKNAVVYAPQGGMVVYSKNDWDDENSRVRLGGQVHYQQRLIDLPDFSAWRVEARVHESVIQQVRVGQKTTIMIDAFQGELIHGNVETISVLPDSAGRWYSPDTKEYIVNLSVTTTTLPLKPGMTAKNEILLDSLKDAIYVPLQAISTIDGKATVYVRNETGTRPQVVEVGLNNDRFAEVKAGLREGEQIVLSTVSSENTAGGKRPTDEKAGDAKDSKDAKAAKDDKKSTTPGKSDKVATPAATGKNVSAADRPAPTGAAPKAADAGGKKS